MDASRRGFFRGRPRARAEIRPPWALPVGQFGDRCTRCDDCLGACPESAVIKLGVGLRYEFDDARCTGCGACYRQCPVHAIEMIPEPPAAA